MQYNYSKGFSLIELVMTIVILGLGVAAFSTLFNTATVNSVDPMIQQQANAIARAYLEEVSLNSFCDPDVTTDCPLDCTTGNTCTNAACANSVGEGRATFDDVCDYDGLNNVGARDQTNNPILELANYNVAVSVFDGAGANLNGLTGGASQSLRIDVTVTHASNAEVNVTATGYRTNF